MFRRLGALAFLAPMLLASVAAAQPSSPARASALATVASRLASELSSAPAGTLIVPAPLKSDEPAPRGDELAIRLSSVLSGAVGNGSSTVSQPLSLSAARSAGRRTGGFAYVQIEVQGGELRASADLYPVPKSIWDRILRPNPSPYRHVFASARLDAEVRSFLQPVPLVLGKIDKAITEDRDLVAMACGDVDDDGSLELVTVGRRRIAKGRLRDGRFAPSHVAEWARLSSVAPAPMREPMAGIALLSLGFPEGSFIDVGLTDRAHGIRFDSELGPKGPISGLPIPLGGRDLCASFAPNATAPTFSPCAPSDPPLEIGPLSSPADIVITGDIITTSGESFRVLAARDPQTGELRLLSRGFMTSLPAVGAQIAIADLDADGDPEIITGADVLSPNEDALVVHSWQPGKAPRERARIPVPEGVRAVAACPPDGPGSAPIALATGSGEVWVIR